jgi:hypothetical protein
MGCAVGLPLLEAMLPRRGFAAEAAKPPVRMGFVSFPNGAIMDAWRPKRLENGNYALGDTHKPLEDVFESVCIITGLAQDNGRAKGDGAGDHARSAASLLTGAHPVKTSGSNIRVGQSVDQAAAERVGQLTRLPSLEIGLERGRDAGGCDSGYSCAYSNNISWKNANTPMSKEINPRLVFERLFGSKQDAQTLARRTRVRQSVLDVVAEQAADLKNRLGSNDKHKVDQYFTSVREIEQRISRAEETAKVAPPEFETPERVPGDVVEHMRLMYDLMALAFQTDATRIITFMTANEGSNRSYEMVGVNDGHHEISHHQRDEEKVAKLKKIDLFLVTEFARFVQKLQSIPEGNGTLLDNCMVMYGSGLSDGNRHDHHNLPIVLAGKAGGTIDSGRVIDLDRETPLNNLFLSMLDRVGAGIPTLGDSSGRLTAIDA